MQPYSFHGTTLLSWRKNFGKLLENYLCSFSLSQIQNELHRDTEVMRKTSLCVSLNRRKNALLQTTGCIHRLSASLDDIAEAYLLLRGSGATQSLPTTDGSSLLQKRFLGIYFRVTLFIWQRGTWWASRCLPISSSLGLQGRMREVRDVFSQPTDTVHVQIHGNTGGICNVIVKP